jgi:hypothetical protein
MGVQLLLFFFLREIYLQSTQFTALQLLHRAYAPSKKCGMGEFIVLLSPCMKCGMSNSKSSTHPDLHQPPTTTRVSPPAPGAREPRAPPFASPPGAREPRAPPFASHHRRRSPVCQPPRAPPLTAFSRRDTKAVIAGRRHGLKPPSPAAFHQCAAGPARRLQPSSPGAAICRPWLRPPPPPISYDSDDARSIFGAL